MTGATPEKEFLIAQPVTYHYSPTGRCTRGYIAFDLQDGCQRFLKDQWRTYSRGTRPEWRTYQRLQHKKVTAIATAIAGGDIGPPGCPQRTKADKYIKKIGVVERVHSRLVTREIGRPLEDYENSVELLRVCSFALSGTSVFSSALFSPDCS